MKAQTPAMISAVKLEVNRMGTQINTNTANNRKTINCHRVIGDSLNHIHGAQIPLRSTGFSDVSLGGLFINCSFAEVSPVSGCASASASAIVLMIRYLLESFAHVNYL